MPRIYIKFSRWIDVNPNAGERGDPAGPAFTRWLPDGEADAIELISGPSVFLKVWFERFGTFDGFIRYKHKVREVDSEVMARQGRLDGGPLYGLFSLDNVDETTVLAVQEARMDDMHYLDLAKQVVRLAIPKVRRFVMLLRTVYGQHWLEDIPEWDSNSQSLGSYCLDLGMMWSIDQSTWADFIPNKPCRVFKAYGWDRSDYSCYITQDDWSKLGDLCCSDYQPSDVVEICNRSRRLLDEGRTRHALIEAMSALEIAVLQYVRRKCDGPLKNDVMNGFDNRHAKGRMALVAYLVPGINPNDIQLAAEAIEHRNDMIHEGKPVPDNVNQLLWAAMRIIMSLLDGPPHKCPPSYEGNTLFPPNGDLQD